MKYIKRIIPVLLLVVSSMQAQPQRRPMDDRRENIEAMKVAFITRELNLGTEEAQKFWPVYNSYTAELRKIREDRKDRLKDAKDEFESMADKDVEKLIDTEMQSRQQELDVQKKYLGQFKAVLPVKKVARLYRAEEKFKRELIERIREKREEQGR